MAQPINPCEYTCKNCLIKVNVESCIYDFEKTFCSRECEDKYHEAREKICPKCGFRGRCQCKDGMAISDVHWQSICSNCGKEYPVDKDCVVNERIFCSQECADKFFIVDEFCLGHPVLLKPSDPYEKERIVILTGAGNDAYGYVYYLPGIYGVMHGGYPLHDINNPHFFKLPNWDYTGAPVIDVKKVREILGELKEQNG